MYGNQVTLENIDAYKDLLSDTLFMCLDYRNQTAHGGRIYNYIPSSTLRPFMDESPKEGLSQLVFALEQIEYGVPVRQIHSAINNALNHYCSFYPSPDDIKRLGDAIGITITPQKIVLVNEKNKIYHIDQHCSGSRNLKEILLDSAISEGYKPCKRCCNNVEN